MAFSIIGRRWNCTSLDKLQGNKGIFCCPSWSSYKVQCESLILPLAALQYGESICFYPSLGSLQRRNCSIGLQSCFLDKLWESEGICFLSWLGFLLQEETHVVSVGEGNGSVEQWLLNPQQHLHVSWNLLKYKKNTRNSHFTGQQLITFILCQSSRKKNWISEFWNRFMLEVATRQGSEHMSTMRCKSRADRTFSRFTVGDGITSSLLLAQIALPSSLHLQNKQVMGEWAGVCSA